MSLKSSIESNLGKRLVLFLFGLNKAVFIYIKSYFYTFSPLKMYLFYLVLIWRNNFLLFQENTRVQESLEFREQQLRGLERKLTTTEETVEVLKGQLMEFQNQAERDKFEVSICFHLKISTIFLLMLVHAFIRRYFAKQSFLC